VQVGGVVKPALSHCLTPMSASSLLRRPTTRKAEARGGLVLLLPERPSAWWVDKGKRRKHAWGEAHARA
jgi:hypothetical protein